MGSMNRVVNPKFALAITSLYALIALAWLGLPDFLFVGNDRAFPSILFGTSWDASFVLVTATLLFLGLRAVRVSDKDVVALSDIKGGQFLRPWMKYLLVVAGMAITWVLQLAFDGLGGPRSWISFFLIPVVLSAMLGGWGPGVLATLLALVEASFHVFASSSALRHDVAANFLQLSFLVLIGLLVSLLSGSLTRGRNHLRSALHELQQKTQRLQASESTFHAMFEFSPVAMGLSRLADGVMVDANPAFEALVGMAKKDIVGHTSTELQHWANPADRTKWIQILREHGYVQGMEIPLRGKHGEIRSCLLSARVILLGDIPHILGVLADVTAEHAARAALLRSQSQFRMLMEAITDYAFFLLDPDGTVQNWSVGAQGIKGYTSEEIIGHAFSFFYTEEDRAAGVPERLLANAALYGRDEHEGWRLRRDGSRFWAKVVLYAIRNGEDQLIGYAKVTQDLTQQKAAEQVLRDSEARYAGIIEGAMDGIITIDANQRILLFNAAAEAMFGYPEDAMLGQPLELLIPPTARASHAKHVETFGRTGETRRRMAAFSTIKGLRANGEEFPIEASISSLEVSGQKVYTVILRDVSDRVRSQALLNQQLLRLESLNAMNQSILAAHDPREVAAIGLKHLHALVPFWGATAMVIDWRSETATMLAIQRESGSVYNPGQQLSLESYGRKDLEQLKQGRACLVTDLGAMPKRPATLEMLYQQGMCSYVRIPLMAEGRLLGVLNLASDTQGAFTAEQQEVAEAFAQQLAVALQQTLLHQRIERLNHVYAVLSGINTLIVRCHDRIELFQEVCRIAVDAGAFKMAWVGLIDPLTGDGTIEASYQLPPDLMSVIQISSRDDSPVCNRPSGQAMRSQQIVLCNDLQAEPSLAGVAQELLRYQVRSAACLPLVVEGKSIGVVTLFAGVTAGFDEQERRLLEELAGDISFALDHIQKEERLAYLAYYDGLTGLSNRMLFGERLVQQISSAAREAQHFAIAYLDIEHFKSINDVFGRSIGDAILQQVAARLEEHVQDAALLARVNADQFAVILPEVGTGEEAVRQIKLLQESCLAIPLDMTEMGLRLSAKFGIAIYPDDGLEADILLEHAEAALKRAKAAGEPFLFYHQEMSRRAAAALALENKLREAAELEQFVLHYQPKVEAGSRRIIGVEALIRWDSPELGLVPPAKFIPLLEETGLIVEVGAWALARAVRDYHGWKSAGLDVPRIAVNVSPKQLRRPDFLAMLKAALAQFPGEHGIDLEITESLIMDDIDSNIVKLHEIRRLGLNIAIDDFGTGYSSLAYLAKLPVQALKIDQSFIATMLEEEEAMTLVEMIISLAHSMGLKVVAEGVETQAQANELARLNCDVMQGYLFSHPLPRQELERLLLPLIA